MSSNILNQHGTFHLKLNTMVTRDYEDITCLIDEWKCDPQMTSHPALQAARELLIITATSCLPRKRTSIKSSLEKLYADHPDNINIVANMAAIYNSLLLTTKVDEMRTKLEDLLANSSPIGKLRRCRALAEQAFILIGDVASQEVMDDTDKLETAFGWFSSAVEKGRTCGMPEDEVLLWTYYRAKVCFRLENRFRHQDMSPMVEIRKRNFEEMLGGFATVFLSSSLPTLAVFKAMSLMYPAEIFSSDKSLPSMPRIYSETPELQNYHINPIKGCEKALSLLDTYSIRIRYARVLMNFKRFPDALKQASESLKIKPKNNWFAYSTRVQIYKNWYVDALNKNKAGNKAACKLLLTRALDAKEIELEDIRDRCYMSACTLLDIADIFYYLGIDPDTKEAVERGWLERAVEYIMLARERVEGYKNVRAHARLAHCLWALGDRRPAIELMKRATELEKSGYTKNLKSLCEYLLEVFHTIPEIDFRKRKAVVKELAAVLDKGNRKFEENVTTKFDEVLYSLSVILETFRSMQMVLHYMSFSSNYADLVLRCSSKVDWKLPCACGELQSMEDFWKEGEYWSLPEGPDVAKSTGWKYDFLLFHAEADVWAVEILKRLEQQPCDGFSYKGFFPDRNLAWGESKFVGFPSAATDSKVILILVTPAFQEDALCRMLLDECLLSGSRFADLDNPVPGTMRGHVPPHRIIPVVLDQCPLPFGLTAVGTVLRCDAEGVVNTGDMARLKKILDQ